MQTIHFNINFGYLAYPPAKIAHSSISYVKSPTYFWMHRGPLADIKLIRELPASATGQPRVNLKPWRPRVQDALSASCIPQFSNLQVSPRDHQQTCGQHVDINVDINEDIIVESKIADWAPANQFNYAAIPATKTLVRPGKRGT